MSKRIGEHLRSNVIGYVAIFLFAVGGTAYATHPGGVNTISSADIINGEVKSVDVGNGEVQSVDIAPATVNASDLADDSVNQAKILSGAVRADEIANNAVGAGEVIDDSLGTADLGPGSVGSSEIVDGSVASVDVQDGSVAGVDIQDGSVGNADTAGASASSTGGICFDDDQNGEVCTTTNIAMNETSRLLVTATGGWHTHAASSAMNCLIDHDGFETIGVVQSIGEAGTNHPSPNDGTMALTGLSAPIGAGTHAISVICTQTDADIDLSNSSLAVTTVDG